MTKIAKKVHFVIIYMEFVSTCLNLKKVDTFGSNTKSKHETKDTDTSGVSTTSAVQ